MANLIIALVAEWAQIPAAKILVESLRKKSAYIILIEHIMHCKMNPNTVQVQK